MDDVLSLIDFSSHGSNLLLMVMNERTLSWKSDVECVDSWHIYQLWPKSQVRSNRRSQSGSWDLMSQPFALAHNWTVQWSIQLQNKEMKGLLLCEIPTLSNKFLKVIFMEIYLCQRWNIQLGSERWHYCAACEAVSPPRAWHCSGLNINIYIYIAQVTLQKKVIDAWILNTSQFANMYVGKCKPHC